MNNLSDEQRRRRLNKGEIQAGLLGIFLGWAWNEIFIGKILLLIGALSLLHGLVSDYRMNKAERLRKKEGDKSSGPAGG